MLQRAARTNLFSSGLQAAANIATIVAASLLSIVLVRMYFLPGPPARRTAPAAAVSNTSVGNDLRRQLSGIDWKTNGRTVLLVLSSHCHFCSESAPFFRQLSEKSGKAFKIVAVLPEPVSEARDYLKREGVRVDQIRQVSLDKLGIAGTPTMLLVNGGGIVTQTWVGKLAPGEQGQALKIIGAAHA
jgi:thiol-disulfide isomerase/thioredoxin